MSDDTLGPAAAGREQHLADAFVELADTLVADYDVLEFLHALAGHCVDLLDVDAAGLMLADRGGVLRVAASSSEQVRLLELYELQNEEGPCLDCFASGAAVSSDDLEDGDGTRWPRFGSEATAAGFRSVLALPLRLRSETIGALNMFRIGAGPLGTVDRSLAQALADVATIGILQERGSQRREVLARQLQDALSSRVVIEQAKGVIAERLGLHVDEAFDLMRSYARSQSEKLSDVADRVVSRKLDLKAPRRTKSPRA
ncbi:MAG TPA: GAF and ANTAR domain-containing protein [Actinomycetes bacterium]|nr:GAF and ANTAR domain-containing protein [Actinomycetes bacterium]